MTSPAELVTDFLDRVDPDRPRVVVRWVDETRIGPTAGEGSGYTIAPTAHVVLTASVDGAPAQKRVEGITLAEVKRLMREYPFEVLYRSDNITR